MPRNLLASKIFFSGRSTLIPCQENYSCADTALSTSIGINIATPCWVPNPQQGVATVTREVTRIIFLVHTPCSIKEQ